MKRYIKRWISFILFMCVFVQYPSEGVVMAADSDQKNIQIVGTASMNTYDVALRVGKTKQLVCNGTTGKMVWKSSNPKIATVDKKGLVKAIKPGKAMISVSGGNLIGSMTCKVGVSKKITTKQARRKIMAMKKTYKEGLSWTNENRQYFWEATNCQCYGCIALCGEISDKVFGKYAPVTKHSNFSRIKAGDHIRIGNEHSVMVLQKNGNTLTVVEGNYNATVHWGRKITKKELQESGFYVETRYWQNAFFVFGNLIIEQCLGRYGLQGIGWYKKSKSDKKVFQYIEQLKNIDMN